MAHSPHWLRTRRQLLAVVKSRVLNLLGSESADLRRYKSNYQKEFRGPWRVVTRKILMDALMKHQVVLGADFHGFSQSQRVHLRVLRELAFKRPLILGLECFLRKDQPLIDKYLRGRISESTLLRRVDWDSWGFPWSHYQPLLDWAKGMGVQILALDDRLNRRGGQRGLRERDRLTARTIAEAQRAMPEKLIYCVVGDLHVAKGHLPAALKTICPKLRVLRLFQNTEELFFRSRGDARAEIWRRNSSTYCVQESPPWVKWQSYLILLEEMQDRELSESDHTDVVAEMVDLICTDFNLRVAKSNLAVTSSWGERIDKTMQKRLRPNVRRSVDELIRRDRSFILPEFNLYYLSRATVNHAAGLAGQYVHAQLSLRKENFLDQPKDFLPLVWIEGVAFFFSKCINHQRKASKLDAASSQMRSEEAGALRLALWQSLVELRDKSEIKLPPAKLADYLEASRILGTMLGDRMYRRLIKGRLNRGRLQEWLSRPLEGAHFADFYFQVVRELNREGQG